MPTLTVKQQIKPNLISLNKNVYSGITTPYNKTWYIKENNDNTIEILDGHLKLWSATKSQDPLQRLFTEKIIKISYYLDSFCGGHLILYENNEFELFVYGSGLIFIEGYTGVSI